MQAHATVVGINGSTEREHNAKEAPGVRGEGEEAMDAPERKRETVSQRTGSREWGKRRMCG